jgi:sporulation protein YabP
MPEEQLMKQASHQVLMENRTKLTMTGIQEVLSFDESETVLRTALGDLTLRGTGFHILRTDSATGELTMEGEVADLMYSAVRKTKEPGTLMRLFRL